LQLWDEHLCHHNTADIQKLVSSQMATGITLSSSAKCDPICEPCLAGKMHSAPFPSTGHRAAAPLDLIHSDVSGPMSVSTPEGVTAMLAQSKLPMCFWGRCLAAQVKVWNCLPTSSLPGETPYEAWYGQKPDLSRFRVFGCQAYDMSLCNRTSRRSWWW
jgi:hypothetical protein